MLIYENPCEFYGVSGRTHCLDDHPSLLGCDATAGLLVEVQADVVGARFRGDQRVLQLSDAADFDAGHPNSSLILASGEGAVTSVSPMSTASAPHSRSSR